MRLRWIRAVAFLWPLLVTAFGVAYTYYVGITGYDVAVPLILIVGPFGWPFVVHAFFVWLPQKWDQRARVIVAIALATASVCAEVFSALCLYVILTYGYLE